MIIKGNGMYIDSIYIYVILTSKVIIYNKKNFKIIHTINIKNPSIIISDWSINCLIICTTKSTIRIFSLETFEIKYEMTLNNEVFKLFYDYDEHNLYTSYNDLIQETTKLIKFNVISNKMTSIIINELVILEPIEIKEEKIVIFCKPISEHITNNYYICEYNKKNLELINCIKKNSILNDLHVLNSQLCYNLTNGLENIYSNKVIYYKNIGLYDNQYLTIKNTNNYLFISNYKNAYLLNNKFEIVKRFSENDFTKAITDISISDGYIYILKGSKLFIEIADFSLAK